MNEAKSTARWFGMRGLLGRAGLAALAVTFACGGSKPPVHVTEVPIDQFPTDKGAVPVPDPATAPAAAEAAPAEPQPAATAEANTGARPAPIQTAAPATTRASVPAGQRLTAAECSKMTDKYAILLGVSQGMSMSQASRSVPKLRAAAASDPTYTAAQASCPEQNTKKQYQCAMRSGSLSGWKACVE